MKVISLYAIDTTWWIAILTLGMAGKLVSSRMRAVRRWVSPPLKPIYFPKLKSTVEVDKTIPWWWRDNAVGPHAGENRKPLRFKAGGLSGIAPKMIPTVVRSRDFITEVSEITNIHTCIYIYIYTNVSSVPREMLLIRAPLTCPFHISRQPSISRKTLSLSPIRQDGYLMLDIFSPLYFPSTIVLLF